MVRRKVEAAKPKRSRTFSDILPPEIRNMIYKLLPLVFKSPIKVTPSKNILHGKSARSRPRKQKTGILRVDKQTYLETSQIFYSQNKFIFGTSMSDSQDEPNLQGFKQFITRVPKQHLAAITNVELTCCSHSNRWYASISDWAWIVEKMQEHFQFPGTAILHLNITHAHLYSYSRGD